jgi:hypothetical protein
MTDLVALKAASRWLKAKLTRNVASVAKRLIAPPQPRPGIRPSRPRPAFHGPLSPSRMSERGPRIGTRLKQVSAHVPTRSRSTPRGDGLEIDSQLDQLIAAMATFQVNNPGFNSITTTQTPNDTTLQGTIGTAWHH